MWHKDEKSVCALVLAIVDEAQTCVWSSWFSSRASANLSFLEVA